MQARFAHLCTIMSRMHHRRRGYPFGSLVDFATDNQGRMFQNLHWRKLNHVLMSYFLEINSIFILLSLGYFFSIYLVRVAYKCVFLVKLNL